jgi:hypothetical protein
MDTTNDIAGCLASRRATHGTDVGDDAQRR